MRLSRRTDLGPGQNCPGAKELGNTFQFKCDFQEVFCAARSVEVSRALNPAPQTSDQWLARYASHIPLE